MEISWHSERARKPGLGSAVTVAQLFCMLQFSAVLLSGSPTSAGAPRGPGAMMEVEHAPLDFDGVSAGAPAM